MTIDSGIAHLDTWWAAVAVLGSGVAFAVLIGVSLVRAWRHSEDARRAKRASQPQAKLSAGPVVLAGTIEAARESEEIVSVALTQVGEDISTKDRSAHSWREVDRSITAVPFYLRTSDGQRIRVEPSKDVVVMHPLDDVVIASETKRVRTAHLRAGDALVVRGRLREDFDPEGQGQAYRDAPKGWVVSGKGPSAPLLLSPEPLAARFRRRSRFYAGAALGLLLVFGLVHGWHGAYHTPAFARDVDAATVIDRNVVRHGAAEGHPGVRLSLTLRTPWHEEVVVEADEFDLQHAHVGARLPIHHRNRADIQLGRHYSWHLHSILALPIALTLALLLLVSRLRAHQGWQERKVVIDKGYGRLSPRTGVPKSKA